jgi:3',5'-cyclic-AMP phosphodiesterase
VSRPFVLAHLSDPHIGADWAGGDPTAAFAAAIDTILAMPIRPDAALVSGDLSEHGTAAEYEQVRELLAPLRVPVYPLPGNHDDRATLRGQFGLPGAAGEPVQYSVNLGSIRLVVVDTTVPLEVPGALDPERLAWLDAELSAAPTAPTLVAMHHPAHTTGIPAWDEFGLTCESQTAFAEVVAHHPQVRRVVAGHFHRTITAAVAGCPAVIVPSTYAQLRLTFETAADFVHEPPGFAFHAIMDGELVSHVQPVL